MKKIYVCLLVVLIAGCTAPTYNYTLQLPARDIEGLDLVQRFPGSVRIGYENSSCHINITYYVKGNLEKEISNFYKEHNVSIELIDNYTIYTIFLDSCNPQINELSTNEEIDSYIKSALKARLVAVENLNILNKSAKKLSYISEQPINMTLFKSLNNSLSEWGQIIYSYFSENTFFISAFNQYYVNLAGMTNSTEFYVTITKVS